MNAYKSVLSALTLTLLVSVSAAAQQITGVPGSPSATTTINGEQLPAPPEKFGGKIEREATKSKPYWPARIVPPKGAPNILVIMTDDAGYGVASTFGGVIPTPALDRIAQEGLRYTNFHSTALCSPTLVGIAHLCLAQRQNAVGQAFALIDVENGVFPHHGNDAGFAFLAVPVGDLELFHEIDLGAVLAFAHVAAQLQCLLESEIARCPIAGIRRHPQQHDVAS